MNLPAIGSVWTSRPGVSPRRTVTVSGLWDGGVFVVRSDDGSGRTTRMSLERFHAHFAPRPSRRPDPRTGARIPRYAAKLRVSRGVRDAMSVAAQVGTPMLVGGAVRDHLLGTPSSDADVEVYGASLDDLARVYRERGYRVDEVGKAFGVLKVSKHGGVRDLDVAVPRRENAVGAGHRGFEVRPDAAMTMAEAAARRDFTINAMSYDPREGVILDPFGGMADIRSKTLRAVGSSFAEDPLRVLRGMQFAARFRMVMDPKTVELCRSLRPRYDELPVERVRAEWTKLWRADHPERGLDVLTATGWDDTIPGLPAALASRARVSLLVSAGVAPPLRDALGAAVVAAHMAPEHRDRFLDTVLIGSDPVRLAKAHLSALDASERGRLDTVGEKRAFAHRHAKAGFRFRDHHKLRLACGKPLYGADACGGAWDGPVPVWVQGRDLVPLIDAKPGPWVGAVVSETLDMQHRGAFVNPDEALVWAVLRAKQLTQN